MPRYTFVDFGQSFSRAGPGRVFTYAARQPSWVTRIAFLAAAVTMTLVVLLLLIPAILIGIAAFLVLSAVAGVRRALARLKDPNGPMDGRRNVRVIVRDERG